MARTWDCTLQELNSIFNSLEKRRDAVYLVCAQVDYMMNSGLDLLSDILSNENNQTIFRMHGSRAESLCCVDLPDEFGDWDIMIFPTSDNLMIYDEMIEYLPENPLHVRIKGTNHPVFQSCLVEDTEYVATSALKNFHPSLYGKYTQGILVALKALTTQEIFKLLFFSPQCDLKNSITSPAATLNINTVWSPAAAVRYLSLRNNS